MKLITPLLKLVLLVLISTGCEHDPVFTDVPKDDDVAVDPNNPTDPNNPSNPDNPNPNNPTDPNTPKCDENIVYFKEAVLPVFLGNCAFTGCHGGGSASDGVELSNYENIVKNIVAFNLEDSEIYEVITEDDPDKVMPPTGRMSQKNIDIITQWIEQGAKNNSCNNTTNSSCDISNVTFSKDVNPVIQSSCVGCHGATNPRAGISLVSYQLIKDQVDSGRLFGAINHENGFVAMPLNQPKLEQCKIDKINAWIDAGATNN